MADAEDRLLSVAEVSRLLSVTEPTVREWIKDGKLQAHRAGARFWRIRQSEVDRMLGEQASNRPAAPRGGARPPAAEPARDLISSLITNPEGSPDAG
jgi:excisionase family DNA binding protein